MALSTHVPDLAALEVLLSVARTGSLNSAARQAGVSQQAVSARIRAMEAQTGVALVHRTPRGSRLTAEGVVIAERAARLLDVAAELDAGIAALRQDRRSRLRVSASSTIAEQLLPAWLASFAAAARRPGSPAPDIVLTEGNTWSVIGQVTEGTADLGFTEGPHQPAGLRSSVIGHDRLAVVVAPGHPWARRRCPGTPQAPAALSVSTAAAVRAAVLAGAAPAVISELAVTDDLAAGRLIAIQIPELDLRRTLYAIWTGSRSPPAGAARDLIAHILNRQ